ncbi:adenylate/guanylate cyclase domain-containing protein [Oleiharenicola lentus]|uniref:Adenylate/guanylate cyclase domain-containing protein n=1 Tax=Oleiharenicola lentus TaxID=2508720 RepID=A0A4Q1C679_9BACT|nr:adenylate/guanylate cyclase domain-containing protein [Oleiharenicola lentus]RXK54354.1 adenylate/guanylate cyclase domain-containing protein [Oleiharenicola lentus]
MASVPSTPPIPGQRTLAAIVFTDVVGFSAHMQKDEETTLRLLKQDFDTMRELCTQHEGSVLKTTGDGLLMYYASAVQAVASALAIQRTFAELAKSRPADKNLLHRVGIHLGDVFVDKEDVMGDGVNIAARLQAEAEPGGICISQTVYHVVRNKLALQVTRLGPRELKNISQAIPIYKLLLKAQSIEEAAKNKPFTDDGSSPPMTAPRLTHRSWLVIITVLLSLLVGLLAMRGWTRHKLAVARAEREQAALNTLMQEEPAETGLPRQRVTRTIAEWRTELKNKRSRALENYDFAALAQDLKDPESPTADEPETRIRAQVLQRTQVLFGWMTTHLQKYNQERPLVVRELTGTSPKEIRIYVGPDRRLYYKEGGATRQRNWHELKPPVLAAIVAGAIVQADPLPPREVVQGALAFATLYNLPELRAALAQGRGQRFRP